MADIARTPVYSYIFPGQGTQKVGMGRSLFERSPAAREVFREADDSLGIHLSKLMFEGPSPRTCRTPPTRSRP